MARIFVSYRRADSVTITGRIHDRLVTHYDDESIFKDVDDIPLGVDFRSVLEDEIDRCDIQLVIIGPRWLSLTDDSGRRRIDNPDDFVRIEVEAGLRRAGLVVIPVLVQGAAMPSSVDLPGDLRELAFRNAAIVRDDPDFHRDMTRLIRQIEIHLGQADPVPEESEQPAPPAPQPGPPPHSVPAPAARVQTADARRRAFPWTAAAAALVVVIIGLVGLVVLPNLNTADTTQEAIPNEMVSVPITAENAAQLEVLAHYKDLAPGGMVWSPDGRILAVAQDKTITLYDHTDLESPIRVLRDHESTVAALAFSADGQWLVSGGDYGDAVVRLWRLDSGQVIQRFEGLENVRLIGISADLRYIVAAGDEGEARAWRTDTGEELFHPYGASDIYAMAFGPEGAILAMALDDVDIWVWDINQFDGPEGGQIAQLSGHGDPAVDLAFSPDGRWLASAGFDESAKVWDLETGEYIHAFHSYGTVWTTAFSPDGKLLATGSEDHSVRIWNLETGEEMAILEHADIVHDVAFSLDGTLLAAASADTRVHLWDIAGKNEVAVLTAHSEFGTTPTHVTFNPDGTWLLSAGEGDAVVWGNLTP